MQRFLAVSTAHDQSKDCTSILATEFGILEPAAEVSGALWLRNGLSPDGQSNVGGEISLELRTSRETHQAAGHGSGSATAASPPGPQVRQNVLRTLASEVRSLGAQFRKQQKAHLSRLQQNKGGGSSWLPDSGPFADGGADEYDPGFTELQVLLCLARMPKRDFTADLLRT